VAGSDHGFDDPRNEGEARAVIVGWLAALAKERQGA